MLPRVCGFTPHLSARGDRAVHDRRNVVMTCHTANNSASTSGVHRLMGSRKIDREIETGIGVLSERDPVIGRLIKRNRLPGIPSGRDPFESLVRAILSQQISGKAATTIVGRVEQSAEGLSDPERVARLSDSELAACGVSTQKRRYLRSLTDHVLGGELDIQRLNALGDREVIDALTVVTGIGTWTAKMFAIFTLGRLDILPFEDLGVRNGIRIAYGLPDRPTEKQVQDLADQRGWSPYRSLASWYMWRATEANPE